MWVSWGLLLALIVYALLYGPVRPARDPLFGVGFLAMLVAIGFSLWAANRARKTVHCGKCRHRFFDGLFVLFPVKEGCSKCDASLDHAFVYDGEA